MPAPKLLMTPGLPGVYTETPCVLSTEDIEHLIEPMRAFWEKAHKVAPPMPLLVAAFRHAWMHHRGPRRKLYAVSLFARDWALFDLNLLCMCWATGRPDSKGAWLHHKHIANWPAREPTAEFASVVLAPVQVVPPVVQGVQTADLEGESHVEQESVQVCGLPSEPSILPVPSEPPRSDLDHWVSTLQEGVVQETFIHKATPAPAASSPAPVAKKPSAMGKAVLRAQRALAQREAQ